MNTQTFLKKALQHGIRLAADGDKLDVDAPKDALTPDVMEYMRRHKPEIVEALTTPPGEAFPFACLMELPDGRQFWLAPDGMKFDAGGIPILRRSIMDKLTASGAAVKSEIMRLIDALHEMGGEVRLVPERAGARPLSDTQKAVSGEMVKAL